MRKGDVLTIARKAFKHCEAKRIEGAKVYGTGCTLSSAIATQLAQGLDLVSAIRTAKATYRIFYRTH